MTITDDGRVLIVGGGRAGVAAAEELRRQRFGGEITLLYDEVNAPYDRPACAKGLLTGHIRPRDLRLPISGGLDVDWRLGRRAVHLDTAAHTVITDTDEVFEYDGLVIATGARAVPPPCLPLGEPGIHLLYRLEDAWALRADLHDARRVAVIGGGLTGSEVACAVRSMARECVLIDSGPYPLTRPIGEHAARFVVTEMRRAGVELRTGRRVSAVRPGRRGWVLELDDGEEITADVVVASTGERPDTGWLAGTPGIDTSDGVLCDETLRVVGADDVVAAGTVARWPNLQYSAEPGRVGQWIAALEHGRAAARTLLAGSSRVDPVIHLPRFWSDQFGLRIQVCGTLPGDAEISLSQLRPGRKDVARSGMVLSYHQEGRMVGLVAVNAPHAFTSMARAMIVTRGAISTAPVVAVPEPRRLVAVG